MKRAFVCTLPLLLAAQPVMACTAETFRLVLLSPSNPLLFTGAVGQRASIAVAATTTGYNGADGDGPLNILVNSGGGFTLGPTTFSPATPAWGQTQPFSIILDVTPTTAAGSSTITFDPRCGSFRGNPVTIPVVIGTPTLPPTGGGIFTPPTAGEPVNTATGELYGFSETADIALGGPLAVSLRRYYASFLRGKVTSALGPNWMHNFDLSLAVRGSTATATVFRGKTVTFTQTAGAWRLSSTEQRNWQLVASGANYLLLDPNTNTTYTFNSAGALTAVQDRNGNTITVTQGANGPTQVSDGAGRTLTFTYTGANLSRVADQSGRAVSYEYTGGNLSAFTDLNAKRTTFAYSTSGGLSSLMTSQTRPAGNQPFVQTYDAQGRVATQTDSFSNRMSMTYGSATAGTAIADAAGTTLNFIADSNLNVTSVSDPSGSASRFAYDANQRPTQVTDRTGARSAFAWDAASAMPSALTDQLGNATSFTWTASAQGSLTRQELSAVKYADGATRSFTRDAKGNVTSVTDPAGNISSATYSAAGLPLTVTNAAGGVYTYAYNTNHTLDSVRTPAGDTTRFAYDSALRLTQVTYADGATKSFTYDTLGNVTRVTDPRNNSVAVSYDSNNNRRSVTDALGAVSAFAFDGDDRLTGVTDPLNRAITRSYDAQSRLRAVTNAAGNSVTFTYNNLNHLTAAADASGNGFTYTRDAEGRLTAVTDALNRATRLVRDARGQITRVTTPRGDVFTRRYDNRNRVAAATDPLGRTTAYAYDPRGLLTAIQSPGGVSAQFDYNALRNVTSVTDAMGNAWQRGYDNMGRQTSATDPLNRATSVSYDNRGRVSQVSFPAGGTLTNSYDAAGNNTGRRYSDGTSLSFVFNANNRLTSATGLTLAYDANNRITGSNGLTITRDAAGRIATVLYGANRTVTYTYSNRGLLASVADWVGGTTTFTYDNAAQLTAITFANGATQAFTYDANGRMLSTAVTRAGASLASLAVTRDALGRVTGETRSAANTPSPAPGAVAFAYDAAAQALGQSYDDLGRTTRDTARSYTWDQASRLTGYSGGDGAATFTYDALGQRISRTSGGITQNYVWNYATSLPTIATVQQAGADQSYYIWLPSGKLLASIAATGSARRFYHFDEAGSAMALTDDAGAVTDTFAISPYGETVTQTGTTVTPFTYQGQFGIMREGTTGLYYMRARYYDSTAARFLSRDPAAQSDPREVNPYQFVRGTPLNAVDPDGRETFYFDNEELNTGALGRPAGGPCGDTALCEFGDTGSPSAGPLAPTDAPLPDFYDPPTPLFPDSPGFYLDHTVDPPSDVFPDSPGFGGGPSEMPILLYSSARPVATPLIPATMRSNTFIDAFNPGSGSPPAMPFQPGVQPGRSTFTDAFGPADPSPFPGIGPDRLYRPDDDVLGDLGKQFHF